MGGRRNDVDPANTAEVSTVFGYIDCYSNMVLRKAAEKTWKELRIGPWLPGKNNSENTKCPTIPLFLCRRRSDMKSQGVVCPYELIVELSDLLPSVSDEGKRLYEPIEVLNARLAVLQAKYGGTSRVNFWKGMQSWLAGSMRRYMMLDTRTHGTSQYIDSKKVKRPYPDGDPILKTLAELICEVDQHREAEPAGSDKKEAAKKQEEEKHLRENAAKLKERLVGTVGKADEVFQLKELLGCVFSDRFEDFRKRLKKGETLARLYRTLQEIYRDAERDERDVPLKHNQRLPVAYGDRAKYVTPTGKLNLLLIDDKIDESPLAHLEKEYGSEDLPQRIKDVLGEDDWGILREVFDVQKLDVSKLREDDPTLDLVAAITKRLRAYQQSGLCYDLILVDLCLGDKGSGRDHEGYEVIHVVKEFFPGTPIAVYSRFDDMGHVARAFDEGAKWFVVKGTEAKLPRHALAMLKHDGWEHEWTSAKDRWKMLSRDPESDRRFEFSPDQPDFERHFIRNEEWEFLTWKSLKHLPGERIRLERIGGGISAAVTIKATKGSAIDGVSLQMPSIVKIDSQYNTMIEYERYCRMIRPYMPNESGRIEAPAHALNRHSAAVVYTFTGKHDGSHDLQTMADWLRGDLRCQERCDYERYRFAVDQIFDDILPKIHRVSPQLENADERIDGMRVSRRANAFPDGSDGTQREWTAIPGSSFPNVYLGEWLPNEFWKSYVSRLSPKRRITIDAKTIGADGAGPFCRQSDVVKDDQSGEINPEYQLLIFHGVAEDRERPGFKLIEAYDKEDGRLVLLDGDTSDFIARFRKQIHPGVSLWFRSGTLNGAKRDGRNCFDLQDKMIDIAEAVPKCADYLDCRCPVGIVHGDLNFNNIMLESRIHAPTKNEPDVTRTISDVWLIDFARTRRDLITHDFNVFFTSVLSLLLDGCEGDKESVCLKQQPDFKALIESAVCCDETVEPSLRSVPDSLLPNARLTLVWKLLFRCRMAAMKAGVSPNMYLLTTALACLTARRIFLERGNNLKAAVFLAVADICHDLLPEKMKQFESAVKNNKEEAGHESE